MRPVDQTKFGFPGGNCFSACVASILELDVEQVPYFMADPVEEWMRRLEAWLDSIKCGLYPVLVPVSDEWYPAGYYVLSGQSPRKPEDAGALHSVVARGREVVHDPHPSRDGLLTHQDAVLLVPRDPLVLRLVRP